MKITLADPKILSDTITIISELVTEAKFKVDENGLELIAMDPANVAMVIFKLPSTNFIEQKVKKEEIAINLGYFKQILKRVKASDTLTLETSEGTLEVIMKGRTTRRFSMSLLNLEEEEQKVPNLKFNAKIKTESSILTDAIGDVDIIGDSVAFIVDNNKLIISSVGDLGKANITINADEFTKIETTEPQKAKYSIEYLKKMIKAAKFVDELEIKFSTLLL